MPIPAWDLTQYYSHYTDPQINIDLELAELKTQEYVAQYRGRIGFLEPADLAIAIKSIEDLSIVINKPSYYLHLVYEAGGDDLEMEKISRLQSIVDEKSTLINNQLTFFDVELSRRNDIWQLVLKPELKDYAYYLQIVQIQGKHILSEEVEQVLSLKSLTSGEAWKRFFTDQKSKIDVELNIYGEKKSYGVPGLMDLMKDPDRDVRNLAFDALTSCCEDNESNVLEAYNNIIMDKKITDQLRNYSTPQEATLISNQISESFVDSLVATCQSKTDLVQRYYKLKNRILHINNPQWYDIYAQLPLGEESEKHYSWEECQSIILKTFSSFHPRFGEIAKQAFDNNWIDGVIRKRKYGGAFCSSFAPGYHPVILCNYKGKITDISTVAHELGHLIHGILTEEKQTLWNCNYTMSMAEIASLCCETLVFEHLYQEITDPKLKLRLLCEKIEEEAGNIFMGGLGRYTFESKVHNLFREEGELSKDQIRQLWLQENFKNVYGDVFQYPDGCKYTWQLVAHFTYIFYNYVYASGLLISSAIYEVIKNDENKKAIYLEILSSGGSDSPSNLLSKLGLDIESPEFWQIGFQLFEDKLIEAEKLWLQIDGT
jgi:oligoendopeptidase F